MVPYQIISTGSCGNAVVVNQSVLIDCGVPFRDLLGVLKSLKLVLLTHIHGDHFRRATVARLSRERPTVRFGCCQWMVVPLLRAGVPARAIDVLEPDKQYQYGNLCSVEPVSLVHNVPNCGYKLHFHCGKVFYATDTNNLNGISAKHYDLYLVESNFEDSEIQERIAQKQAEGRYAYEQEVLKNHLSKAKCDDFLYRNMSPNSEYIYMHSHVSIKDK